MVVGVLHGIGIFSNVQILPKKWLILAIKYGHLSNIKNK